MLRSIKDFDIADKTCASITSADIVAFAMCAMRDESLSRFYTQCRPGDTPDAWTDDMFFDELRRSLPAEIAFLRDNEAAQHMLAENYLGLPF